jgi:cytochrome P450
MYEQELKDIGNTREVTSHARLRNILSPGFSARALTWQEEIVQKYVDLLIEQIKAHSREGPVNIVDWFEWMSFDIIGDLTFAESFDALKHGEVLNSQDVVLTRPVH